MPCIKYLGRLLGAALVAMTAACAPALKTHESDLLNTALNYPADWVVAQPEAQTLQITDDEECSLLVFPADNPSAADMGVRYEPGISTEDLLRQFRPVAFDLEIGNPIETVLGEALTAYREESAQSGRYVGVLAVSEDLSLIFLSEVGREYEMKDNCVPTYRDIIASIREME